jgi:hypothetical protein
MQHNQPTPVTTKPSSRSKSVTTVPQDKTILSRGRSATPSKSTYPIFLNNASTTTTSSLTLGSSVAPFQQHPSRNQSSKATAVSTTIRPIVPLIPLAKKTLFEESVPSVRASDARRGSRIAVLLANEKVADAARYAADLAEARRQKQHFEDMDTRLLVLTQGITDNDDMDEGEEESGI